jgi:hypothetical protein
MKWARIALAVAGVGTLVVTIVPGLTPFKQNVDPNLGLGGLVLLFIWPLVVAQIVVFCLRWEKWAVKSSGLTWTLLIIVAVASVSIDNMAIRLVFR